MKDISKKGSAEMETVSLPELSSKALPDDCVMYSLFFGHNVLSRLEQRKVLQEVRQVAEQLTNSFLSDYLWQREGFNLELVELDGKDEHFRQLFTTGC